MAHTLLETFEASADDEPRNGAATAALTLGLLSLVLSVLAGVPAVVAGVVGLARARSRGTGAVRSAVGLLLGLGSVVLLAALVSYLAPAWTTVQQVRAFSEQGLPAADSPQAQAGADQAREALASWGVDPASVDCGTPAPSGTSIAVDCTGTTTTGEPAQISASCPATELLGGAATCEATVNGQPHRVRVVLQDGMPVVEVL